MFSPLHSSDYPFSFCPGSRGCVRVMPGDLTNENSKNHVNYALIPVNAALSDMQNCRPCFILLIFKINKKSEKRSPEISRSECIPRFMEEPK